MSELILKAIQEEVRQLKERVDILLSRDRLRDLSAEEQDEIQEKKDLMRKGFELHRDLRNRSSTKRIMDHDNHLGYVWQQVGERGEWSAVSLEGAVQVDGLPDEGTAEDVVRSLNGLTCGSILLTLKNDLKRIEGSEELRRAEEGDLRVPIGLFREGENHLIYPVGGLSSDMIRLWVKEGQRIFNIRRQTVAFR